jgi:hypothetical protein
LEALLELAFCNCVGWSAFVPEFQKHPGNDTLLTATSLSETRRNHKEPNQPSKEGVFSGQKFLH